MPVNFKINNTRKKIKFQLVFHSDLHLTEDKTCNMKEYMLKFA